MSITIGAAAATRLSCAAASQVVQPRFDAPATTNPSTLRCNRSAQNSVTASIARTALLVIGNSSGQV